MKDYSQPLAFTGAKQGGSAYRLAKEQRQQQKTDWAALVDERVDVVAKMWELAGIDLGKVKGSRKQLNARCPFPDCSSTEDAFMVWPHRSDKGQHYHCRKCKRSGDIIKLLEELKGWKFLEVVEKLELLSEDDGRVSRLARERSAAQQKDRERAAFFAKQLEQLRHNYPRMRAALAGDLPRAYLESRGATVEQAQQFGLAYLLKPEQVQQDDPLAKWYNRIIFPLTAPDSDELTFAGRTLELWEPGMTPAEHKAAIEKHNAALSEKDARRITRVKKTSPCGWFGYGAAKDSREWVYVEGEFDALASMLAGIVGVIAVGTAGFDVKAIPAHVERVTLALDCDNAGALANRNLARDLAAWGFETRVILPPGKDWSDVYAAGGVDAIRSAWAAAESAPAAAPAEKAPVEGFQMFENLPSEPDAADPASDQGDGDSDEFMMHCATCGASIESPDMDFRFTPDGILYCLAHYPQADEPAQNGQDGSDQTPHDDGPGIETLRGLLLQTGEALDYPSLEIAHNGRVIPVAGAAHYWRNLAERGERALLVQALALLQDKPAQCCQCDAPVWVFAADGKPYCYQHAPVCAAVAQTRRAESAAPAQGKKRIVEIDGVRMFVGYSDAEYKAAILQEYAGAAQSASEPHRSRPASGVVYCQQHQGRRAVVSDESGAYCHECWQARRFHCSIVESYGHDNGWPRLAVLGIEAGQASYEQFLKAAPEQRLEYASTTLRNPHTRRLFADDAA